MCSVIEKMPFIYCRDSRETSSTPTATGGSLECCEKDKNTATVVRNYVIQYEVGTLNEIFHSSIYFKKINVNKFKTCDTPTHTRTPHTHTHTHTNTQVSGKKLCVVFDTEIKRYLFQFIQNLTML
jgi:hypothetical protein